MWSEKKAWSTSQWKTWWQKSRQKAEVMFSSLIPCQWTLNQHYRISKYTIWNRLVFTLLSLSVHGRSPKRTQSSKLYQIRPYQNVTLNVWIILPELIKQQQQIHGNEANVLPSVWFLSLPLIRGSPRCTLRHGGRRLHSYLFERMQKKNILLCTVRLLLSLRALGFHACDIPCLCLNQTNRWQFV